MILIFYFNYNYKLGGGFFIKLSVILFDNFFLFYLTSFIGLLLCSLLAFENKDNVLIIILMVVGMSSYVIFQKYFEPMFLIILFLLMKTKITEILLSKKTFIYLFHFYFIIYLLSAILNDILKITKTL